MGDRSMMSEKFIMRRMSKKNQGNDKACRPCPYCKRKNMLTADEAKKGYQCSDCADNYD